MSQGMRAAEQVSSLTVLVRGTIGRFLAPPVLAELHRRAHSSNYEEHITHEALLAIMLDAVIGTQPSPHAAMLARRDEWTGSLQALYKKFERVDPNFATHLVSHTASEIRPLMQRKPTTGRDPLWRQTKVIDGTMPDGSEHRLGVLRRLKAAGLPANFVIVYDLASGLCERVAASEDAYTNERTLAEPLLEQAAPGEIYLGDRGFCTTRLIGCLDRRQAFFVFRECDGKVRLDQETPEKPRGRCSTGRVWESQVRLCETKGEGTWTLRRIHLLLDKPTQRGETEIWLLTNLPPRYKARAIADQHLRRWEVERHFYHIKCDLRGEMPRLGQPRAAIFAMCAALAAGNVLALVKHLAARQHGKTSAVPAKLSPYYLVLEISHSYRAIEALTTAQDWRRIANLSPADFLKWARKLAAAIDWTKYPVHSRGPKQRPPPRFKDKRNHHSTHRLLTKKKNDSNAG